MIKESFKTDSISALGLPPPVSIGIDASVGEALAAVQNEGMGYVLVVDGARPVGIMSEQEVLMRIVARDVKYDANVKGFISAIPRVLTEKDSIARAIHIMDEMGESQVPVVDDKGTAVAVVRNLDILNFLGEAFPAQVLNLPPKPHQTILEPEGA